MEAAEEDAAIADVEAAPPPSERRAGRLAMGGLEMAGVPKTGFVARPEDSVGRAAGKGSG